MFRQETNAGGYVFFFIKKSSKQLLNSQRNEYERCCFYIRSDVPQGMGK